MIMTYSPFSLFKGRLLLPLDNFNVAWQSPSNIALVKYWGKKEGQLPVNPSLSMTLEKAFTRSRLQVSVDEPIKGLFYGVQNLLHRVFAWRSLLWLQPL